MLITIQLKGSSILGPHPVERLQNAVAETIRIFSFGSRTRHHSQTAVTEGRERRSKSGRKEAYMKPSAINTSNAVTGDFTEIINTGTTILD